MKKLLIMLAFSVPALADQSVTQHTDVITQSVVSVSQSTSQTTALAANPYRKWLYIRNMDATLPIYLSHSGNVTATGTSAGATIKIGADSAYQPTIAPIDKIVLFTVSGSTGVSASIFSGN